MIILEKPYVSETLINHIISNDWLVLETETLNNAYFEDGILKVKTEYSKKGWYKKNIYFDEEYLVSTYFENNIRKKDVYFYKGSVLKEKIYE